MPLPMLGDCAAVVSNVGYMRNISKNIFSLVDKNSVKRKKRLHLNSIGGIPQLFSNVVLNCCGTRIYEDAIR